MDRNTKDWRFGICTGDHLEETPADGSDGLCDACSQAKQPDPWDRVDEWADSCADAEDGA